MSGPGSLGSQGFALQSFNTDGTPVRGCVPVMAPEVKEITADFMLVGVNLISIIRLLFNLIFYFLKSNALLELN